MQGQSPSPQLELDISRLEKELELYSQEKLCYEAQILRVGHISFLSLELLVISVSTCNNMHENETSCFCAS